MTNIKTTKVEVENGADFTFICRKIPFAITCSELHHGDDNLIDLGLVNSMKIPLRNIRVTRMNLLGHDVRAVGRIKQTVQCVVNGRVQGNVHLQGKVVRNLSSLLNVDCLASTKTYERLMGRKPPDPLDEGYESPGEIPILGDDDDTEGENDQKEEEIENTKSEDRESLEEEPPDPDPNVPPALRTFHAQCLEMGYKDIDDCLENIPTDPKFIAQYRKINGIAQAQDVDNDNEDVDEDNVTVYEYLAEHGAGPTDRLVGMMNSIQNCEDEDEYHCDLCFRDGKPLRIVTNHEQGCPTCPTMTPNEKLRTIGSNWKAQAEMIIKMRYQRQKQRK